MKRFDPFGPGSPPWNAFDSALEAAMDGRFNSSRDQNNSFPQKRARMRYVLKVHGADQATINAWTAQLNERVANNDFDGVLR
jgi:hypothetical protein